MCTHTHTHTGPNVRPLEVKPEALPFVFNAIETISRISRPCTSAISDSIRCETAVSESEEKSRNYGKQSNQQHRLVRRCSLSTINPGVSRLTMPAAMSHGRRTKRQE